MRATSPEEIPEKETPPRLKDGANHDIDHLPTRKVSRPTARVKRYLRVAQMLRKQGYHTAYGHQMIAAAIFARRLELRRARHG